MKALRASLLTALLGLLALLVAWWMRPRLQSAEKRPIAAASEDVLKKAIPPPKRDFPRKPPPMDAAFAESPSDEATPDVAHPWADYLKKCADAKALLMATKMDLKQEDADFATILAEMEAKLGVRLNLDVPLELQSKKISFHVKDLNAWHVLRLLIAQYDCRYVIDPGGLIWIEPLSKEVSVHEPAFAAELAQMKALSTEMIARLEEKPANPAIKQTTNAMSSIKISLNFTDTPLAEVVSFMQEVTQLNIMVDRRSIEDVDTKTVTFKVDELAFKQALDLILKMGDLGYEVVDGVIVLRTKETLQKQFEVEKKKQEFLKDLRDKERDLFSREVAFGGENLRLREVAEILAKGLGVPFQIDPGTWSRKARYTIEERQRPASEIVKLLHKGAPVIITYRDGILWFLSPEGVK